ncbi:type II secretion system minor pseudopilin GspJ [Shewanella corallii]|uniref:Type II secretion system protein J n=1 Tax=Shewanella corallii TaxID=560080 RepID=A0ABT0NCT2_9GAMM|nr:type II secretion system minor pseudopilin GspJ [Shewanella corallii]MCL2916170.1 type II secretion system minor pseudopilin GspJ [Shewanella corallii]
MWRIRSKGSRGFTLLEMLIAIAIFAMLGVTANAVLQTVMRNDQVTQDFSLRLKGMQQGFGAISRDLAQMVARSPRLLEGGRSNTIFQAGPNLLDSQSEGISFYRLGWLNPEGILPRGSIQAVAYVHVEDRLERWYYPYPDPELGAEPEKTVLMDKVLEVKYAFFLNDSWEKTADGSVMPKAIAMEVELDGLGVVTRKFLLPEQGSVKADNDDNGGNNGGNNSGSNNTGGNNSGGSGSGGSGGGGEQKPGT